MGERAAAGAQGVAGAGLEDRGLARAAERRHTTEAATQAARLKWAQRRSEEADAAGIVFVAILLPVLVLVAVWHSLLPSPRSSKGSVASGPSQLSSMSLLARGVLVLAMWSSLALSSLRMELTSEQCEVWERLCLGALISTMLSVSVSASAAALCGS